MREYESNVKRICVCGKEMRYDEKVDAYGCEDCGYHNEYEIIPLHSKEKNYEIGMV